MIHPKTELRFISEEIGYGVFATENLPVGTITYVKDSLESIISPTDYLMHSPEVKAVIDKYSYIDQDGNRIVSWDFAKYVNHCCNCNTMSTGYGFEIAIRDILKGEQITDEYGIFNLEYEMEVQCGSKNCRKILGPNDFDNLHQNWDNKIQIALPHLFSVEQPLMTFIDAETRLALDEYFVDPTNYRSVYALKLKKAV
jgi:hypothetical protein